MESFLSNKNNAQLVWLCQTTTQCDSVLVMTSHNLNKEWNEIVLYQIHFELIICTGLFTLYGYQAHLLM